MFQGTGVATFEARDEASGALLWRFAAQDGIMAGPVSYAVDGVQYVAVVSGYGGGFGLGEGQPTPTVRPNGRVLVFALDGKASLPEWSAPLAPLNPPAETFSPAQQDRGRLLYTQHCYRCHGAGAQASGVLPDLRRSTALADAALWRSILLDGLLASRGMVSFAEWLKPSEVEDIRAYVALKARIAGQQETPQP